MGSMLHIFTLLMIICPTVDLIAIYGYYSTENESGQINLTFQLLLPPSPYVFVLQQ